MLIKKTSFEEIPEHIQGIIEDVITKLKCDNIFDTDKGFYILENTELNRIYIEIYNHDIYEGVTLEDVNAMIKHFNINDPHIFNYPYSHTESLLGIGKVLDHEIIY